MNARYALPPEPRSPHCGPAGLWAAHDLLRLVLPIVLGAGGSVIGWYGSAQQADWHDDVGWITLSAASVSLACSGILLWLLTGRARLVGAQRQVRAGLIRRQDRLRGGQVAPPTARVTAELMRRQHRPHCLLMIGKQPIPIDPERTELTRCGVCDS